MSNHKATSLRDLNWGFLSQGLNMATGLLLLPVVLISLPPEEVGLWFVFSTLGSLAQLLELGFQPTIARYVAYVYGGAQRLEKVGIAPAGGAQPLNKPLLGQVFLEAKRIYRWITLAVSIVLLGGGSTYIISLLSPSIPWQHVIVAWILFSLGFLANFYFGYLNAFVQGRGGITDTNRVVVLSRTIMIAAGSVFLLAGFGLVGLGLASLLSAVTSRLMLRRLFWNEALPETAYLRKALTAHDLQTSGVLWHNALKLGWVYLGAFLITRMNILIASKFLGLTAAASYGLTMQILSTLVAIASTLFTIRLPTLNAEQIRGPADKTLANFSQSLAVSWALFGVAAIIVILFGNSILALIGSHTQILDTIPLVFFFAIMLLEMNHSLCASYLTTYNEIPFVTPALLSGFFIVVSSVLLISVAHLGVWGLLLSQGIVQLAYNNWKWPMEAAKKMGCSFFKIAATGCKGLRVFNHG